MDNTFFYWDDIYEEKDRYYSSIAPFGEPADIYDNEDFECDYDCEGCWFEPETCGKKLKV